jgi:hypothetical protein
MAFGGIAFIPRFTTKIISSRLEGNVNLRKENRLKSPCNYFGALIKV